MADHIRVEVLSEDDAQNREAIRRTADFLAKILDSAFTIPGTQIRIGLDPLIGMVPGVGDAIASFIGSARRGRSSRGCV